jgi:hypothetical protein
LACWDAGAGCGLKGHGAAPSQAVPVGPGASVAGQHNGAKNAGIRFQMMINDRVPPGRDIADAYIDDIIIDMRVRLGEDRFAQRYKYIRPVLSFLVKATLVADIHKCNSSRRKKNLLATFCAMGHSVRRAIEKWETPRTISELRAFLGFTNYYNIYIQDYAKIVARP